MGIHELLVAGDFAAGFRAYELWRASPDYPKSPARQVASLLRAPRWEGQDLRGKSVLIASEEGFGDQIMYARFVPLLQALGAQVTWLCPPELTRLFSECLGVSVLSFSGERGLDRPDFCIPSGALPAAFFPRLAAPPEPPYLRAPPPVTHPGLRIGLAASGNPKHLNDQNRSLPSHLADQLAEIPGVVRLSPEVTGAKDFYDTARVVAGLDLVISVDTSIAHLSAAMGKPTWVLLPYIGVDWRWGGGVASPWYPSARLFRQAASCDWTEVIDQVKSQLPPEA